MDNTRVVYHDMPCSIRGFTTYVIESTGERFYTIFLNPIFSTEKLKDTKSGKKINIKYDYKLDEYEVDIYEE